MIQTIAKILMAHMAGDYLFQSDYLAQNKGKDWYILFVHCVLYCIPFAFCFGINWKLAVLFGTHFVIDAGKARYNKFGLAVDQTLHYIIAALLYLV